IFSVVKSAHALAASYNALQNLHAYIRAQNDAEAKLFESQVPTFLGRTKNLKPLEVVRDIGGFPKGCESEFPTPTVFLHVLVRGQVDLDGESNKSRKKLDLAKMSSSKIQKVESQVDYELAVSANVRLADEKVRHDL
ncbi:hypothetical protein DICSQDRAFT_22027, partial [Dichomitus squalens LYAD-421 SS1]